MTIRERVNEYAKTVYQLFWQKGVTDVMKMLVTTLDFIYLKRKADTDPYAFNGDDTFLWGNLCLYDKIPFEEIYTYKLDSFYCKQKKYDFMGLENFPSSLTVHEFSGIYELFHLTDELFKNIDQMNVKEQDVTLYGLIFEELVDSWGILKQTRYSLSKHIAKLLPLLVDVRDNDSIYIPNGGIGELPLCTFRQVQLKKIPNQNLKDDIDGFTTFDNQIDYMHSLDRFPTKLLSVDEKNKFFAYLCAMNFFLNGVNLQIHIENVDFWHQSYAKKQKGKFTKILSCFIEKESAVRILGIRSILEMLAPNGKAAVVVPESFLFSRDSKTSEFRRSLLQENHIDAVISLPKGVLLGTNVKTSILLFSKDKTTGNIWFCDLLNDGYSKVGRRQRNADFPLPELVNNYRNRREENTNLMYSAQVSVDEVMANNSLLAINYYKEIEPVMKEFVDPYETLKDLLVLEEKIKTGLDELYKML